MANWSEKYNRLGYFNLARGLGMLLILLGHSITPFLDYASAGERGVLFSGAGSVLGGGIMAAFFMISGFGFYTRSSGRCLAIQTKLLLKPYCMVAVAVLFSKGILAVLKQRSFVRYGGELVLTFLLGLNAEGGGSLAGIPVESISILWFILALFGGWMMYNSICRIKSVRLRDILVAACVFLSWIMTRISSLWPFCLPMSLLAVGFLAAGSEMKKRQLLDKKLPVWFWAVVLTIACVCAAFGEVSIVSCRWKLGILDVLGSFCVGFLLMWLYARFKEWDFHGPMIRAIETVGFYSMGIVCAHAFEKMIFPWYRLSDVFPMNPGLCVVVCFVTRCVVIWGILALASLVRRRKTRMKTVIIDAERNDI